MIKIICLLSACIAQLYCANPVSSSTKEKAETHFTVDSLQPQEFFTLSNAEKVLGEPAHLADSTSTIEQDVLTYRYTFTANAGDPRTRRGNIYFLLGIHPNVESAQADYTTTRNANASLDGMEDLGDQAYFHTDSENFYFIMVRKGANILRMKVNRITRTTSLNEFNAVAKEICRHL